MNSVLNTGINSEFVKTNSDYIITECIIPYLIGKRCSSVYSLAKSRQELECIYAFNIRNSEQIDTNIIAFKDFNKHTVFIVDNGKIVTYDDPEFVKYKTNNNNLYPLFRDIMSEILYVLDQFTYFFHKAINHVRSYSSFYKKGDIIHKDYIVLETGYYVHEGITYNIFGVEFDFAWKPIVRIFSDYFIPINYSSKSIISIAELKEIMQKIES